MRRGGFATGPGRDHTVKVDVDRAGAATGTTTGSATTAPPAGSAAPAPRRRRTRCPGHLRFGVVSCANLQAGWFCAYRHLAARDDLDAVIHLGDYLYEYAPGEYGYGQSNEDIRPARARPTRWCGSPTTGSGTRSTSRPRPAGRCTRSPRGSSPGTTTRSPTTSGARAPRTTSPSEGDYPSAGRRAHRAFDEWMPVRMGGTAALGDGTRLFRRLQFGTLAELSMLDLRTYRDEQVRSPRSAGAVARPARSATRTAPSPATGRWRGCRTRCAATGPQWKLVGNPVMIAPVDFGRCPTTWSTRSTT